MNLIKTENITMSSREIAGLTGVRHDSVKRTMDGLKEKGIITFSQSVEKGDGRPVELYHVNKRDSLVVVARVSPEFTAAVVDRWQELESQAPALPQTFAEALRLAADQAEVIEKQKSELAIAAPKAEFVDRYTDASGLKGFREVCKLLKVKENVFRAFLIDEGVMYRLSGKMTAYAQHVDAGRFETKTGEKDGHAYTSCKFTPKGVTWISQIWSEKESYYKGDEK